MPMKWEVKRERGCKKKTKRRRVDVECGEGWVREGGNGEKDKERKKKKKKRKEKCQI